MTWVIEDDNGSRRTFDTRSDAEDVKADLEDLGADISLSKRTTVNSGASDNGANADAVDGEDDTDATIDDATPVADNQNTSPPDDVQLPASTDVTEDPVSWMPSHFIDVIDGTPAINRKGYAVLAEHYEIEVTASAVTYPGDTEFTFAEFEATAVTPEGHEYSGYGSAHVDRSDEKVVLGELAETRAIKRALALATGIGMTAVCEMKCSGAGGVE